jgi:two-component system sensor histidine kinase CreC
VTRRSRIFVGLFVVYLAAVGLLLYRVATDLDPRYRESAEESLVDTAQLLATLLERRTFSGVIPTDELERTLEHLAERPVYARIFDIEKTRVNLHVYVTDRNGVVLFDSRGRDVGRNYLNWRDVRLTLAGSYGARTTLANDDDTSSAVMYVGAAIRERRAGTGAEAKQDIVGMVSVGKPIESIAPFIANARAKLVQVGLISVGALLAALAFMVFWLVRPLGLAVDLWQVLRNRGAGSLLARLRLAAHALRVSLAEARDALAGRSYAEQYVQTLAHEIKSPLAAIRGAAELLREPMSEPARARFAGNIVEQVARAQDLVERMLELANLERRGTLERIELVSLAQVVRLVVTEATPTAERKHMRFEVDVPESMMTSGDAFLLARAISNLVRNAIDFAPLHSTIEIAARAAGRLIELTGHDYGPGLPPFAQRRVFEKFFSTARPDTGKKGTGLGLAFVREVATLHGGTARLANHPEGGAVATLQLPRAADG